VAAWPVWFGGSTPARFLAPFVFPLSVMVAPLWSRQDNFGRCVSIALLVVSVLIACVLGFGANGTLAYNSGLGRAGWLDWVAPAVNLPGGVPSYFRAVSAEGTAGGSLSQELLLPAGIWALISIAIWSLSRSIHIRCAPGTISRPALAAVTLFAVLSAGVASTWAIASAPHVMTTRAQLRLIAEEDPRATRLGVQLHPFQVMSSTTALQRLEVSTSPLDPPRAGALLNLYEVPPGDYQLRLSFVAEPRGHIRLLVGGVGEPVASWDMPAVENSYRFRLPIPASALTIVGDTAAAAAVRSVALTPIRRITTPWTVVTRARGAARYGHAVVYAIDNRIIIEPDGFWVLGGRQPDVVITTDSSRPRLTLQVSNIAIPNRLRVSNGAWSETRELAPDERWLITVPLRDPAQPALVNFRVEQGIFVSGRFLGCRISIVE
jgi:hypothetical protein